MINDGLNVVIFSVSINIIIIGDNEKGVELLDGKILQDIP